MRKLLPLVMAALVACGGQDAGHPRYLAECGAVGLDREYAERFVITLDQTDYLPGVCRLSRLQ